MSYKEALGNLDKNTRTCILHLEKTINEKFMTILSEIPQQQKVNVEAIYLKIDSIQKQVESIKKFKKEMKNNQQKINERILLLNRYFHELEDYAGILTNMTKAAENFHIDFTKLKEMIK